MKIFLSILAVVLVLLLFGGCAAIRVRNGLITKDEMVKEQWSQVDTQLVRRADLIPNLVNTVKGYAAHESEIFTAVAQARRL